MAWTYDWVAAFVSLGRWKDWVSCVLPYFKEGIILELGHGPGHLQAKLLERRFQVIGLDASPQMSRLAKKHLRRHDLKPVLVRGVSQKLPFAENSIHNIVATFPSEYIVDPQTLSEIRRLLDSDGQAIILALAWITGRKWLERAAAGLFHITGQAPEWEDRFLEPVRKAGFQAHVDWIELKSSRLVIIVAQKNGNLSNFDEDIEKSF